MSSAARTLALAALLIVPLTVRALAAADPYASLKPLIGTWLVDKDCVVNRQKILAAFSRQPRSLHVEFFDPARPDVRLAAGDITSAGVEDHYRVDVQVPGNPILKALGLASLPGSLVVSDDEDDPDSPGKDYLTCSLAVAAFNSQTTVKLRSRYRKATFIFKDKTPLGKDRCRGTAVKQKPAPKAKPSSAD